MLILSLVTLMKQVGSNQNCSGMKHKSVAKDFSCLQIKTLKLMTTRLNGMTSTAKQYSGLMYVRSLLLNKGLNDKNNKQYKFSVSTSSSPSGLVMTQALLQ